MKTLLITALLLFAVSASAQTITGTGRNIETGDTVNVTYEKRNHTEFIKLITQKGNTIYDDNYSVARSRIDYGKEFVLMLGEGKIQKIVFKPYKNSNLRNCKYMVIYRKGKEETYRMVWQK